MKRARIPFTGCEPLVAHDGDAGSDLRANLGGLGSLRFEPGEILNVELRFRCAIPEGCVGLLFARSGLGSKGLTLANSVGVIDSGYRGSVVAPLINLGDRAVTVHEGDRVCQMVVVEYVAPEWVRDHSLGESERGESGFGSSGLE